MSQHGCPERLSNRSKGFPDESAGQATMEVLVETLTGTAFEMTVSPSDTIFAIKSKIFRVEGIPVSQQHLVYNLKELEDAASLRALGITDGARLRLVLGMRGGPVATRRLPPPTDVSGELERLLTTDRYREGSCGGAGCKVTVLVFRDGERVSMVRVRERGGASQPLDRADPYVAAAESEAEPEAEAEAEADGDNAVTMGKMLELRRRMDALALHRPRHGQGHTPRRAALVTDKPLHKTVSDESLAVCARGRHALLPPIVAGSRADSEQSVVSARAAARCLGDCERLSPAFASSWQLGAHAGAPLRRHPPRARLHEPAPPAPPRLPAALLRLAPRPDRKDKRPRCALCRKRLTVATEHRCRCGAAFCAPHRYAEVHGCAYDYKADAPRLLARANPLVSAPKLPKI